MEKVQKKRFRINLLAGTVLCIIALLLSVFLLASLPFGNNTVALICGLLGWFLLWFFTHDLAHFVAGIVVGIRFQYYYLGRSDIIKLKGIVPDSLEQMLIVLGLKIDRDKSRAGKTGFAAMYLAGPLASMLTPFAVPIILLKDSVNVAGLLLLTISIINLVFTLWFSPKVGCIYKAKKALKQ